MQSYNTSSYFFPASPHLMKNFVIGGSLLSAHRKEIKAYLARHIAQQYHEQSFRQRITIKEKRKRTMTEPSKFSRSQVKFNTVKNNNGKDKNQTTSPAVKCETGLYQLLQKVQKLKKEEKIMESNPFYRIQRRRQQQHSRIMPRHSRTEINRPQTPKDSEEQRMRKTQPKIFHNQNLSKAIQQQNQSKTRTKSETFTYYEIKTYFETKYGIPSQNDKKVHTESIIQTTFADG